MQVLKSDEGDGAARLTISFGDDDYRFEVWSEGDIAKVEYQETLTWRGQIRVANPDDEVWEELMLSEQVTEFLDENGLSGVKRAST